MQALPNIAGQNVSAFARVVGRRVILFLDFDGVLHPFPMTREDRHFSALPWLWRLLEENPDLVVVITSTWRERHSFAELVILLTDHGGQKFVDRFIGVTPLLESTTEYEPGIRQREYELWLDQNGVPGDACVILDDIEEYFDSNCPNLYLVDGVTGLTEYDVKMIPLWVKSLK